MKKLTDITIILDRSGSMKIIKSATIESFNSFIQSQQADSVPTRLTLVQFDDVYETIYENQDIHQIHYLNHETYQPRGLTALLDAIGTTIENTKKRIKKATEKPDLVVMVIITDGRENASTKFDRNEIFKKIRKREDKNQWKFVFLAANQDAIAEGRKFGINANQSLTFSYDQEGVRDAMNSVSKKISIVKYSIDSDFSFDEEDRKKQER